MPDPDPVELLLQQLAARAAALRDEARAGDRLCRLPVPVVRSLVELGLFRLWIPRSRGGLELPLPHALRIYEAAARIDGSVGWAVMIGSGGGLFAACLRDDAAEEIFRPAAAVIAGSGAPHGRAEHVPGGYRVTGRWPFASGADYATTFTASCLLYQQGAPLTGGDGRPRVRAMAFEREDVRVLPTWDAGGMRGTGSHDFEVREVFVPEHRSFDVFAGPVSESGALYRLPFGVLTELPVTAVALGIAACALEEFARLATRKRSGTSPGVLAEEPGVRQSYASSHARVAFVRARSVELASRAWQAACDGRRLAPAEQAGITAACAEGVGELCAAVGALARLAGMSAVMREGDLARAWRDLQTLSAHVSVSPRQLAGAGAELLLQAAGA